MQIEAGIFFEIDAPLMTSKWNHSVGSCFSRHSPSLSCFDEVQREHNASAVYQSVHRWSFRVLSSSPMRITLKPGPDQIVHGPDALLSLPSLYPRHLPLMSIQLTSNFLEASGSIALNLQQPLRFSPTFLTSVTDIQVACRGSQK